VTHASRHLPVLVEAGPVVQFIVERLANMSNNCPLIDEQACSNKTRPLGVCDRMLVGVVLWTLVHTTEALGGDQIQPGAEPKQAMIPSRQPAPIAAAMNRIPAPYQAVSPPEAPVYSLHEFRPRGPSLSQNNTRDANSEQPLIYNTTVWQRLADYRSHDRFSLVTLWETGGNSLSLQAGRKGDPTIQWTSRLMSHPGAGRGLLDELFSTSVGGLSKNLHFNHPGTTDSTSKTSKVLDVGSGGAGTK
jgi:hypothetical protein